MRKVLVLLAGLLMAITVASPPAGAITGDYVEDDEHPFVGLVAFYDATGEYLQRCSGSLLSRDRLPHRRPLHVGADRRGDRPRLLPAGRRGQLRPRAQHRPHHRLSRGVRRRDPRRHVRHLGRDLQLRLVDVRQPPRHQRRRPGHPRPADRIGRVRRAGGGGDARRAGHPARPAGPDLHRERLRRDEDQPGHPRDLPRAADGRDPADQPAQPPQRRLQRADQRQRPRPRRHLLRRLGRSPLLRGLREQPDRRRHVLRDEHLVPGRGLLVPDRPAGRAHWIAATVGDDAWSEIQVVG